MGGKGSAGGPLSPARLKLATTGSDTFDTF